MKLTRKEIALLMSFLVVAVLAIGIFAFVVPVFQANEADEKHLVELQAEWEKAQADLSRNLTIDAEIATAYEEAKKQSDFFYEEAPIYDVEVLIRGLLNDAGIKIGSIQLSELSTEELSLSFFESADVTYPIKDSAMAIYEEVRNYAPPSLDTPSEEDVAATDGTEGTDGTDPIIAKEEVGAMEISIDVSGKKDDITKFMDVIDGLPQATYLRSVSVPYEVEVLAPSVDENGQTLPPDEVTANLSIVMYCVKPCVAPNVQPAAE